jgi:hypothetical protein
MSDPRNQQNQQGGQGGQQQGASYVALRQCLNFIASGQKNSGPASEDRHRPAQFCYFTPG